MVYINIIIYVLTKKSKNLFLQFSSQYIINNAELNVLQYFHHKYTITFYKYIYIYIYYTHINAIFKINTTIIAAWRRRDEPRYLNDKKHTTPLSTDYRNIFYDILYQICTETLSFESKTTYYATI